jgi:hypothetical protein
MNKLIKSISLLIILMFAFIIQAPTSADPDPDMGPRFKVVKCTYVNGELDKVECSGKGQQWCDCPLQDY